jgi:hypothetical protein
LRPGKHLKDGLYINLVLLWLEALLWLRIEVIPEPRIIKLCTGAEEHQAQRPDWKNIYLEIG